MSLFIFSAVFLCARVPLVRLKTPWVISKHDSEICRVFFWSSALKDLGWFCLRSPVGRTARSNVTVFKNAFLLAKKEIWGARQTGLLCVLVIFTDCKWQLLINRVVWGPLAVKRQGLQRGTNPDLRAGVMIDESNNKQSVFLFLARISRSVYRR